MSAAERTFIPSMCSPVPTASSRQNRPLTPWAPGSKADSNMRQPGPMGTPSSSISRTAAHSFRVRGWVSWESAWAGHSSYASQPARNTPANSPATLQIPTVPVPPAMHDGVSFRDREMVSQAGRPGGWSHPPMFEPDFSLGRPPPPLGLMSAHHESLSRRRERDDDRPEPLGG